MFLLPFSLALKTCHAEPVEAPTLFSFEERRLFEFEVNPTVKQQDVTAAKDALNKAKTLDDGKTAITEGNFKDLNTKDKTPDKPDDGNSDKITQADQDAYKARFQTIDDTIGKVLTSQNEEQLKPLAEQIKDNIDQPAKLTAFLNKVNELIKKREKNITQTVDPIFKVDDRIPVTNILDKIPHEGKFYKARFDLVIDKISDINTLLTNSEAQTIFKEEAKTHVKDSSSFETFKKVLNVFAKPSEQSNKEILTKAGLEGKTPKDLTKDEVKKLFDSVFGTVQAKAEAAPTGPTEISSLSYGTFWIENQDPKFQVAEFDKQINAVKIDTKNKGGFDDYLAEFKKTAPDASKADFETFKKTVQILQIEPTKLVDTPNYSWIKNIITNPADINDGLNKDEITALQNQLRLGVAQKEQNDANKQIQNYVKTVMQNSMLAKFLGPQFVEKILKDSSILGVIARMLWKVGDKPEIANMANGDTLFKEKFLPKYNELFTKDLSDRANALNAANNGPLKAIKEIKPDGDNLINKLFSGNVEEINKPSSALAYDLIGRFGTLLDPTTPLTSFSLPQDKKDGKIILKTKLPSDAMAIKVFYDEQKPAEDAMNLLNGDELSNLQNSLKEAKTNGGNGSIGKKVDQVKGSLGKILADKLKDRKVDKASFPGALQAVANGNSVTLEWSNESFLDRQAKKIMDKLPNGENKSRNGKPDQKPTADK